MWTPSSSSYFLSATIFTKPSVSPIILARPSTPNGKVPDSNVEAASDRFLLGETDAADLGIGVGARRHLVVVDRPRVLSGQPLGEHDALRRREMRELRMRAGAERDDVADGRNPGDTGPEERIDDDVATVERQTGLSGAEPVGDRSAADGDEQLVNDERLALAVRPLHLDRHACAGASSQT